MPGTLRRLTRGQARRIAIRAQLLDAPRPASLATAVERLTFLQLDPTSVVAPAADLVAWSRLGNTYSPDQLRQAHEVERTLFEHHGQPSYTEPFVAMLRPTADLRLHLADMTALRRAGGRRNEWLEANAGFRRRVLDQLGASGPLSSRDIPDTAEVPWASTGWTNDRNVTQLLELLGARGLVAVSGRQGRQRLWDLAERVYPADVDPVPPDVAVRIRDERRLQALGILRPKFVGDAGEPVEVEGTKGVWRVDPAASDEDFVGRTALLSPFDRLTHDRVRSTELFDFDYLLEMYKPKEKRRWGYFALPILHHDRMVGKVDVAADQAASRLRVHALHQDVPFTKTITKAIDDELASLAAWLGLDEVER